MTIQVMINQPQLVSPTTPTNSVQFPSLPDSPSQHSNHQTHLSHHSSSSNSNWRPRRESNFWQTHGRRRSRAKSFSEHTQEAVKVVAPPISVSLVCLCVLWYCSSALSSNINKSLLQIFEYPVTLTMLQFVYTTIFSSIALKIANRSPELVSIFPKNTISSRGLPGPEPYILRCTSPMAGFQIFGHILSLSATSKIPVSLVHAIKSLSPLMTVAVYTFAFGAYYNLPTYLSLIPLTLGVMMACAAEFRARPLAILNALLSCVVFVAQNIWSKTLLTTGELHSSDSASHVNQPRKLDKVTIIFWCAVLGFAGTLPIWLLTDLPKAFSQGVSLSNDGTFLKYLILVTLSGFSHFCQNLLSFMILGSVSTVAYSIASLLKRIFVMSAAILWFGQRVSTAQGWGICITFVGLYIYDRFGSKTSEVKTPHALPK